MNTATAIKVPVPRNLKPDSNPVKSLEVVFGNFLHHTHHYTAGQSFWAALVIVAVLLFIVRTGRKKAKS